MAFVLDASALLAYWLDELGAEVVTMAVSAEGAFVAPPNFAEALTKLVDRRPDLAQKLPAVSPKLAVEAASTLPGIPLAGGAISLEPFTIAEPYFAPSSDRLRGLWGRHWGTEHAWGSLSAWECGRSPLTKNGPSSH